MRPVKLIMKAFGSYAQETVVDFDEIGKDLYLITGDTGAGKTTIFDAVVFALYGESSGKTRDAAKMHSDYVDPGDPTEVTLTFEHQGKLHKVERIIKYRKKRGAQEYNEKPDISAQFWEADKPVIDKATNVTKRIEEMIGLNADQFSKIVMLAQGQFRKFLDSKDDDRAEILKNLFDFSVYSRYQAWVVDTFQKLSKSRNTYMAKRNTIMESFVMPEGLSVEEEALYSGSHPQLIDNLKNLMEQDEQLYAIADNKKAEAQKAQAEAADALKTANERNGKLNELATAQAKGQLLAAQEEEIKALVVSVTRAEKALRQVKSFETALSNKQQILKELMTGIGTLGEDQIKLTRDKEAKKAASDEARKNEPMVKELEHQIKVIEDSLPAYDELAELEAELKKKQKKQTEDAEKLADLKASRDAADARISAIDEELKGFDGIDGKLVEAENKLQIAQEKYDRLTNGETGVIAVVKKVLDEERELEKKCAEFLEQIEKTGAAKAVYDDLYKSFLSNQAGAMASKLKLEIEEAGQALCPVCGTHFLKVPAEGFASVSGEVCTEAQVNKARAAFEKEDKALKNIDKDKTALEQKLTSDRDNVVKQAAELFGESPDQKSIITNGYLSDKKAEFEADVTAARAEKKAAEDKVKAKELLIEERKTKSEASAKAKADADALEPMVNALVSEIAGAESAIAEKKKLLAYVDAYAAEAEMKKLSAKKKALDDKMKTADDELRSVETALSEVEGNLKGEKEKVPGAEAAEQEADAQFRKAVEENGFSCVEDYRSAIPVEGEVWIKEQTDRIKKYDEDVKLNSSDVERLTKETAGWAFAETAELEVKLADADAALKKADAAVKDLFALRQSHSNTYDSVVEIQGKLADTEEAYRRLEALNRLAGGASEAGGKLSFERYAMGASFQEILEAANMRLLVMSNGRYELRHTTSAARASSQAGLGIQVYDASTGKQRESNSISGGESFQVSMSLALGLSDVVQRRAGGNKIDAMFIDEGFGSLSEEALSQAIAVLEELSGREKQIGLISHVGSLKECISKKIVVKSDQKKGSTLEIVM